MPRFRERLNLRGGNNEVLLVEVELPSSVDLEPGLSLCALLAWLAGRGGLPQPADVEEAAVVAAHPAYLQSLESYRPLADGTQLWIGAELRRLHCHQEL